MKVICKNCGGVMRLRTNGIVNNILYECPNCFGLIIDHESEFFKSKDIDKDLDEHPNLMKGLEN